VKVVTYFMENRPSGALFRNKIFHYLKLWMSAFSSLLIGETAWHFLGIGPS